MSSTATTYDELPYGDNPFYQTHPDCLATAAVLHGLKPPPVAACRVLELGCARGGNLIPMVLSLPRSHMVGIDLSQAQIASGQRVVQSLGLTNIELKHLSITDINDDFGQFDYIICHGVYSWVPEMVRDKILDICKRNLVPNGVAYLSYNTFPGWHIRGMLREMMAYAVEAIPDPQARVEQARGFLGFLIRSIPNQNGNYASMLKKEVDVLAAETDTYLFHEFLEEVNQPIYFHEFARRIAAKGLQYIDEARTNVLAGGFSAETRTILDRMSDRIQREQFIDFLCNRTFRRSILCHAEQKPSAALLAENVADLIVSGSTKPLSEQPDIVSNAVEKFQGADEVATLSTNNPLIKATLVHLYDIWPRAIAFDDLWDTVTARLTRSASAPFDCDPRVLRGALLQCQQSNLVQLHVHVPAVTLEIRERPVASPLARLQAQETNAVTNFRHLRVKLSDVERLLIRQLDGSHDRAGLVSVIEQAMRDGTLQAPASLPAASDADKRREVLGELVDQCLTRMMLFSLLVG